MLGLRDRGLAFTTPIQNLYTLSAGETLHLDGMNITGIKTIHAPDVLMIPIGGTKTRNTMNENEALNAVAAMKPGMVIPCHYNCPALFSKTFNPANDLFFKEEVEKMGPKCAILHESESVEL
jgi:L-ascorbate metabolism protein UlaG (beta-lactamase superfamily)